MYVQFDSLLENMNMNMVGGRRKRRSSMMVKSILKKVFTIFNNHGHGGENEETLIFKRFLQFTVANVFDMSGRETINLGKYI